MSEKTWAATAGRALRRLAALAWAGALLGLRVAGVGAWWDRAVTSTIEMYFDI